MNISVSTMIICGFIYAVLFGNMEMTAGAVLSSGEMALSTVISLLGGFMLFGGVARVLEEAGCIKWLVKGIRRPLRWLLGKDASDEAMGAVAMNLSANMLGLGNAATPMGLRAAKLLVSEGATRASSALCMLLIINATSVQLYPSTVVALRYAAGSAMPETIVWPALIASSVATVVGVATGKLCERIGRGW